MSRIDVDSLSQQPNSQSVGSEADELGSGLSSVDLSEVPVDSNSVSQEAAQTASRDIFKKCVDWDEATQVRALGIYPYFRTIEAVVGNQVVCEGRRKIMIGSNNYLGLAYDERVLEASQAAIRKYGAGCTGSRFLNGNMRLHEELEEALAAYLERESVLLFSTGFFVNQGVLTALLEDGDFILCDRENHASIIDGCRLSPAKTIPFAHNSAEALERRLKRLPKEGGKLLVADGVFSMSGDLLNLPEMLKVCQANGVRTYVDEAHSLGVYGPQGKGVVHHFGLNDQVDLVMGTFSKSLGTMGGFIAGPRPVIDWIRHKARCFMFTASLAPAVVGGVLKALELMIAEPERREQLWKNTHKMHQGFRERGFKIGTTQSPIVPIVIGDRMKSFEFSHRLYEEGIFTTPAAYPAVRMGEAIVRTSYMATHSNEELDYVLDTVYRVSRELGIFDQKIYREGQGASLDYDQRVPMPGLETATAVRTSAGADSSREPVLRASVSRQYHQTV